MDFAKQVPKALQMVISPWDCQAVESAAQFAALRGCGWADDNVLGRVPHHER